MAFATHGASSLSINTTSANSPFGSVPSTSSASTQPATTSSMLFSGFGTAANSSNNPGTSAPQQPSLFASSKPTVPSLFGNTSSTSPFANTTSGSLFGNTSNTTNATNTSQTAPVSNMFSSLGQTASDQSKQNAAPNAFGGMGSVPAQPTNSLFNTSTPQNSSFGNTNQNKPEEKNMCSGLGQMDAQKPQQQQANQPKPFGTSSFGGLSFGQSTTTNPQIPSVPGVKINIDNLRPTTRFNDLHEDLQKLIETLDNGIQNHMQQKHDCDAIMPKHKEQLVNVPNDVDFLTRKCTDVENALSTDAEGIFQAKKLVSLDIEAAKLSFGAIDNLKLPHQYQQLGPWTGSSASSANAAISSSLPNFFIREAEEMSATLEIYEKNMTEIETHLRDVEARAVHQLMQSRAQSDDPSEPIRELAATFRDFEHGILNVAGKVVGLRDEVAQIKRAGLLPASGGSADGNGGSTRRGVY